MSGTYFEIRPRCKRTANNVADNVIDNIAGGVADYVMQTLRAKQGSILGRNTVCFIGEDHKEKIDHRSTQIIIDSMPIININPQRVSVLYEHGLILAPDAPYEAQAPELGYYRVNHDVEYLWEPHELSVNRQVKGRELDELLHENENKLRAKARPEGLEKIKLLKIKQGLTSDPPFVEEVLGRYDRSVRMGDQIIEAQERFGKRLIYVICGSAHAIEIYEHLNEHAPAPFSFFVKLSVLEQWR